MCRILGIEAEAPVDAVPWIRAFALRCRDSREYQGHGWGVAWWTAEGWRSHRSLTPIWEDDFAPPPAATVLIHARSAFRNEGIELTNNMPFLEGEAAFAFNGELRGVRLAAPGATGAARLFHLFGRFRDATDDPATALARLDDVVSRRSDHVRALNAVVGVGPRLVATSRFREEEAEYFTMHIASGGHARGATTVEPEPGAASHGGFTAGRAAPPMRLISSERVTVEGATPRWAPVRNGTTDTLASLVAASAPPDGTDAGSSP